MPKRLRFDMDERIKEMTDLVRPFNPQDGELQRFELEDVARFLELGPKIIKNAIRYAVWMNEVLKIKLTINDSAALQRINPEILWWYLEEKGWTRISESDIAYYIKDKNGEHGITVPKTRNVGDYAMRMSDVLAALSESENKTQLRIFFELVY